MVIANGGSESMRVGVGLTDSDTNKYIYIKKYIYILKKRKLIA